MLPISLSDEQFQMILILLKYLSSNSSNDQLNDSYILKGSILKNYLLKYAVISIELKNKLFTRFNLILSSFEKAILNYENKSDKITITKLQICSLLKPVITSAAINPIDSQKLTQFFNNFDCHSKENEFFLDLQLN